MPDSTRHERIFVGLPSPVAGRASPGGHPCQGLYHRPAGSSPKVAFIATHFNVDFSEHYLAEHLVAHGFGFLGWNTQFRGAEPYFLLDHALVEIGVGVRWLREQGVETVVLLGNSGGGSLMAAYHSQSREVTIGPTHGSPPAPGLDALEAADLFVFVAAHPGRPEILTDWLDPSVTDEQDPTSRDPSLDMYDPSNGPPFDDAFLARYRAAQVARNERITDWCLDQLDRLAAAGIPDQLFVTRRIWADPRFVDGRLDPSNRVTPSCYRGDPKTTNDGVFAIGTVNTLRTWLNMWSLRESPCRGAAHLARLDLPTLLIQGDGDQGVFPSQAQGIFDALASTDKELVTMPGDHYFQSPPGLRPDVAARIAEWITRRLP